MKPIVRGKQKERKVSEGTWFISYGDMITLLLGFFVLFFSIEPPKKGNTLLAESLLATMEELDKELPTQATKDVGDTVLSSAEAEEESLLAAAVMKAEGQDLVSSEGEQAMEQRGGAQEIPQHEADPIKDEPSLGEHLMEILNKVIPIKHEGQGQFAAKKPPQQKRVSNESLQSLQGQSLKEKGTPTGSEPVATDDSGHRKNIIKLQALQAEAFKMDDRIFIMFPTISFFGSASTKLTKEGFEAIEKFAGVYLPFAGKTRLNIVGFADQRPVMAAKYHFRDNLELSVLRAVSAQRVLAKVGIPTQRVRLMGHGINEKLLKGEDPQSREERLALARKIMFIIEPVQNL
ncbi:flagellar motor protein MotB [Pseudobacteriovorax antillogorgiicola]|uniref:OmpA family protein n=1 Tax=Pseudobacteriovorax antillogorgiicola TaxID=1513793 RepID=A0A1Y6CMX6_9BACT|nr:flagellar motor protein MotB [Pseudobacteriovorax antillogorgiicola]TCS46928.1 OmpA family protein [Pseudobacteriovorax antillogorgiicola]SMF64286.1 OmpA family protein [Pseudobacteriovorax antillogorgiicola]